jgi:hypothetical protein
MEIPSPVPTSPAIPEKPRRKAIPVVIGLVLIVFIAGVITALLAKPSEEPTSSTEDLSEEDKARVMDSLRVAETPQLSESEKQDQLDSLGANDGGNLSDEEKAEVLRQLSEESQ